MQGMETSSRILPESDISYSHSMSAPVGTVPLSISVPLIFSTPIKRLSVMGDWMVPSHSLMLIDSLEPALSDCPA